MKDTTDADGDDITDEELENALRAAHELGMGTGGDDAEPDDDGDE